jgi:hypothetical protein
MGQSAAVAPVPRVREWVDELIGPAPAGRRANAYGMARRELQRPVPRSAVSRCLAALAAVAAQGGVPALDSGVLWRLSELCVDELLETIDRSCGRVLRSVEIDGLTIAQLEAQSGVPRRILEGRLRWAQHGIAQRLDEVFAATTGAAATR